MSSTPAAPLARGPVLADVVAGTRARNVALVVAGALLTALLAQVAIPVPPSPVPVTGQTLAVLLAGTALGARRGAASQALYLAMGCFLPVYSDGGQGLDHLLGATGGYLIGFVVAAWAIGRLAERGADRRVATAVAAFVVGQLIVFGFGVPWLAVWGGLDAATAIHQGFTIFIVGGIVKAIVGGVAAPAAWRAVRAVEGR